MLISSRLALTSLVFLSLVGTSPLGPSARAQSASEDPVRLPASGDATLRTPAVEPGTSGRPRAALAGPVDPAAYRLGPGDVLSLEYGGRALDARVLTIDSEGRARIPNLGVVSLGGRSLSDARAEIVRRLRPYLPGATVDLRLLQPRTFKVYVLGEVASSSIHEVTGSARVLEVIEAAGGTTGRGSRRNIRVLRRDGRVEIADLDRFERLGDWSGNPYLEDGDRVLVPIATTRIGIFGAVARPRFYEYREGDSLGRAIEIAGGLLPEARRDSVLVLRFRGAKDLDTLVASPETGGDIALHADDRVFVRPESDWRPVRQAAIMGEVNAPGVYSIEEGRSRVSDLIRWAGGFTRQASMQVRIERNIPGPATDTEFERLSRLSRSEMTNSEYQTFRGKLAVRQSVYLVDFSTGAPKPPEADVALRDGDSIRVARVELSVRVDGSVRNPGLVAYQEGRTARDYIAMAGGPTARADVGDARLSRSGSGHTMSARDSRRIEPGDFIWVPEKRESTFWSSFRDVVIVTAQAATIILVIDQLGK